MVNSVIPPTKPIQIVMKRRLKSRTKRRPSPQKTQRRGPVTATPKSMLPRRKPKRRKKVPREARMVTVRR